MLIKNVKESTFGVKKDPIRKILFEERYNWKYKEVQKLGLGLDVRFAIIAWIAIAIMVYEAMI